MSKLFASGAVVDGILVLMLLELVVLIRVRRLLPQTIPPLEFLVSIGAGAALLLALREALRGSAWPHMALWLLIALGCHACDLKLRWSTPRN